MSKKRVQVSVNIYLGKRDQDIVSWFNLLNKNGLSRSKWLSALLIAYESGLSLPIGSVTTPTQNPISPTSADKKETSVPQEPAAKHKSASDTMIFGAEAYRIKSQKARREHQAGKGKQATINSHLYVCITNKKALESYERLKKSGYKIATIIKYAIRESLEIGEDDIAPDDAIANRMLSPTYLKSLSKSPDSAPKKQVVPYKNTSRETPLPSKMEYSDTQKPVNSPVKNPLLDLI